MGKTLGSACFIRNSIQYDYNILETIDCLIEMSDYVVVLDAGSDDGTRTMIFDHMAKKGIDINFSKSRGDGQYDLTMDLTSNFTMVLMSQEEWDEQHGKEKLAYFQNIAIQHLPTDYVFLLQADEVVSEDSFPYIRQAMEQGGESYLCHRPNLWGSPDHVLDVPQERKPCSDVVLRLAKRGHLSYGDGESIECYPTSSEFIPFIKILHYGFVRKRAIMPGKIKNMQQDIFNVTPDSKLEGMDLFNPFAWFSKDDLKPLTIKHPRFIEKWVEERRKEYQELWQD